MFLLQIVMIEDPTHLIRRNFVQFSKVYLSQLLVLTNDSIVSDAYFDVNN